MNVNKNQTPCTSNIISLKHIKSTINKVVSCNKMSEVQKLSYLENNTIYRWTLDETKKLDWWISKMHVSIRPHLYSSGKVSINGEHLKRVWQRDVCLVVTIVYFIQKKLKIHVN